MRNHGVRSLLMGGQACVFYGAAEFSRDVDLAIHADSENLDRLQSAFAELQAEVIAVPSFTEDVLRRGHAAHFRCAAPGVEGLRVDLMTAMRGVDAFPALWERRTVLEIEGMEVNLLSLPDLVQAKKTQRAKDWPMIQRLVEAHWFTHRGQPTPLRIEFWLKECRSPEILLEIARQNPSETLRLQQERSVLEAALHGDVASLERKLEEERLIEMEADKNYWLPLRQELEQMRMAARKS
jgi:hypothetical protein